MSPEATELLRQWQLRPPTVAEYRAFVLEHGVPGFVPGGIVFAKVAGWRIARYFRVAGRTPKTLRVVELRMEELEFDGQYQHMVPSDEDGTEGPARTRRLRDESTMVFSGGSGHAWDGLPYEREFHS